MSTISRAHRIQLTLAAATLVVSLFGGIASAFAQSNGGGGDNGGNSDGNGGSGGSAVLLYGTAGNCPPTIACAAPKPRIVREQRDNCSEWSDDPRLYRRCMMRRR
jgi:hypothetical protein